MRTTNKNIREINIQYYTLYEVFQIIAKVLSDYGLNNSISYNQVRHNIYLLSKKISFLQIYINLFKEMSSTHTPQVYWTGRGYRVDG